MPAVRFTKSDITRAVEAAKAADLTVKGIEITRDGTIRILCGLDSAAQTVQSAREPKPWS